MALCRSAARAVLRRRGVTAACSTTTTSTESRSHLAPLELSTEQQKQFWEDGFVRVDGVIPAETAAAVRSRFDDLFAGRFSTGIYPDEWHWREGLSLPNATREIVNAWKSDKVVASVALSPRIGRMVATLMGWPAGTRIAQDDVLWKPPRANGVAYHTDGVCVRDRTRAC
jgi:phytanoyl-CoA hydroxylase